jgi:hypothetical protein
MRWREEASRAARESLLNDARLAAMLIFAIAWPLLPLFRHYLSSPLTPLF